MYIHTCTHVPIHVTYIHAHMSHSKWNQELGMLRCVCISLVLELWMYSTQSKNVRSSFLKTVRSVFENPQDFLVVQSTN